MSSARLGSENSGWDETQRAAVDRCVLPNSPPREGVGRPVLTFKVRLRAGCNLLFEGVNIEVAVSNMHRAKADGAQGVEDSMYPSLVNAVSELLPLGYEVKSHTTSGRRKPDLSILRGRDGSLVGYIEVKLPTTLPDAFKPGDNTLHQIGRYRTHSIPVLLTSAESWFDVTVHDGLDNPVARFDGTDDQAAARRLADLLHRVCATRPTYRSAEAAVLGIAGVIRQVNLAPPSALSEGWAKVRDGLGLSMSEHDLDGEGAGEVVAFTLLAIACQMPPLANRTFVTEALREWQDESSHWNPDDLPETMRETFSKFRELATQTSVVVDSSWVTIRAIAAWVNDTKSSNQWERLSQVWDGYLSRVGRRKRLGSWQTKQGIADFQVQRVQEALRLLGYEAGLRDNAVTVLDPCVGTGVYLGSVIREIEAQGGHAAMVNAPSDTTHPRLLGIDISATAVAAAYIRLASSGAQPRIYMTDTLTTGQGSSVQQLFVTSATRNAIVEAAQWDHTEADNWARRSSDRDPVLAIVGNPPYERGNLDSSRYETWGWRNDIFEGWRLASGGQGAAIHDPFVAFWAWAASVCAQPHSAIGNRQPGPGDDGRRFGVVSFITNRAWIEGKSFRSMRYWLSSRASRIEVVDFGPGSTGEGAGRWSDQPFDIQIGTAIVTISFDPSAQERTILYQQGRWIDGAVQVGPAQVVAPHRELVVINKRQVTTDRSWVPYESVGVNLQEHDHILRGIVFGGYADWVQTKANRTFRRRLAFKAFDNRWTVDIAPKKTRRGQPAQPGEASSSAWWREDTLFDPHPAHERADGWYCILPFDRVLPGPALHATRFVPNQHLFKGSEASNIIRVAAGSLPPTGFADWCTEVGLSGHDFWLFALASAHHCDYWTPGTARSQQLAEKRVVISTVDDSAVVGALVAIGKDLVNLWSLDGLSGVHFSGSPGDWHFDNHDDADAIAMHGQRFLRMWRKDRPGPWDQGTAAEYARSVQAILGVCDAAMRGSDALDPTAGP
ncbi:hypothetical protein BH24ACT15_BH24ACT15_31420 [soil metagenome]